MSVLFYPTGSISVVIGYRIPVRGTRKKKKRRIQPEESEKNQKNQHTVVETKTGKKLSGAKSTKDIHMSIRGI